MYDKGISMFREAKLLDNDDDKDIFMFREVAKRLNDDNTILVYREIAKLLNDVNDDDHKDMNNDDDKDKDILIFRGVAKLLNV